MDDTQDQQNDITSSDNSENTESSEPEIKSGQVFDISDDNISPASNTEEDESIPIVSTPVHNMVPQKISSTPIKNITPPQVIPKVIPITQPIPTPTPAIQTPPPIRPFTGSMSNLEMEIGSLIPKSLKSKE